MVTNTREVSYKVHGERGPGSTGKWKILQMVETTCGSTEKVGDKKRPTAWLLLQPDLVIFQLSRNLRKTCTVGLVSRAPHQVVAYDMAEVTTIEIEAIVTTMLALGIG